MIQIFRLRKSSPLRNINSILKGILFLLFYYWAYPQQIIGQQHRGWVLSKVLNANAGLAQNSVNNLYFDKKTGFLWVATEGGLTVYNGVNTRNYDTRNAPNFRMARIHFFARTYDNEIIAVDKTATGVCIEADSLATQHYADYIAYYDINFGVCKFPGTKDISYHQPPKSVSEKVADILRWFIFIDRSTTLAFSDTAVYLIGKTVSKFKSSFSSFWNFSAPLQMDKTHILLIGKNQTACIVDTDKRTVVPLAMKNPEALKGSFAVYNDHINYNHTLLNGKAIYKFKLAKDTLIFEPFAVLPEAPFNISSIVIHPDNNRIFIGSLEKGVLIYTRSFFYTYQFSDPAKYTGNKSLPLIPQINNLYASVLTDSNHLHAFTQSAVQSGIELNLDNGLFSFSPIKTAHAMRMTIDTQKNIYFEWGMLRKASFNKKKAKDHLYTNVVPGAFYYDSTYDKVWAVDMHLRRLGYLTGDSLTEYLRFPEGETGFMIAIKRVNGILLVYGYESIFRVDEQNKKLIKIYEFDKPLLRDVYVDKDNYVWISTYGKGIYMYDQVLKKLYHPPIDPAGNLAFSHSFIEDGQDNFFIPTNNGLYRISRKILLTVCKDSTATLFYHYYDVSNGLVTNEFNGGCTPTYNKLSNGDILIPSMQGMVRVFTSSIPAPHYYPIFIQRITTPRKSYDFASNMSFGRNERILTWEVNFAQWDYAASPGLSYQLDNDTVWTYIAAGERKIMLSDLRGGAHTLRIRNQFDLAGNKASRLAVNFYITKRYYEQTWFWILTAAGLLVVIYLVATFRNLQLRRTNLALERKINKNTIEIKKKNIHLEDTLANLNTAVDQLEKNSQFQQKLIGLLGHDIMTPLQYINKVANQLVNYRQKLKEETTTGAIMEIGNTATQLLFLGESIIQWIKLQEGQFIPHYSRFDLHNLVAEISILHQSLAAEKKNCIVNEVPEGFSCIQDPMIVKIILHNLLLNANKFTSNGKIAVDAVLQNDILHVTVADEGVGMDDKLLANLNNMKTGSSEKGTNNEKGWGLGYSFIIAMIKIVQGSFSIESAKGKGTKVMIEFPSTLMIKPD